VTDAEFAAQLNCLGRALEQRNLEIAQLNAELSKRLGAPAAAVSSAFEECARMCDGAVSWYAGLDPYARAYVEEVCERLAASMRARKVL
jgi:hypothetical protein